MTDVTMIGLGAMGSALARAFIGAGHSVTVWNRTAARIEATGVAWGHGGQSVSRCCDGKPGLCCVH